MWESGPVQSENSYTQSGWALHTKIYDHNLWAVFDQFSHSACELQRFSISIFCGQFPPHLAMNLLPVTLLSSQAVSSSSFYITEDFHPSQNINWEAVGKGIYPKYSKQWPYTVAHKIDCVCSMDNGYLNKAKNQKSGQRLAFWAGLKPASAES